MPKVAKPLTAIQIKRLTEPGYHAVGTVPGLYLQVTSANAKSWVLRIKVGDKRREVGLGSYPEVELAAAWEKAREARQKVEEGVDPVEAKREARSRLLAAQRSGKTFSQCADAYIAAMEPKWKNARSSEAWRNTLTKYVEPLLGKMLVRDIQIADVLAVLEPIWTKRPETSARIRQRMEAILDWSMARGYRPNGANPAKWKGFLDKVLPATTEIAPKKHRPHLPPDDMTAFMKKLAESGGNGARALEFLILTNVRSANVRMATWSEVNLQNRIWTIPGVAADGGTGQRMKTGVEFEVPLSDAAMKLLEKQPRMAGTDLIFPSPTNKVMSDMTILGVMRRMGSGADEAVPHGFRSTFKTWSADRTNYSREVIEAAMGHRIKDKAEAAYMRGNWLEKRRPLMQAWAGFISGGSKAKVVPLQRQAA